MHAVPGLTLFAALVIGGTGISLAAPPQPEVKARLEQMGLEDQSVRNKLTPSLISGGPSSAQFKAVADEMAAINSRHLSELEKIIEQYGWPDRRIVGTDASNSAFLVLQHSPLAAQKKLLPVFRDAVASGKARNVDLALLEDRVLVGEGKKQLYGTQITSGPDGKPRVDPVEDPVNLDARRSAIGLMPMDQYLEHLERQIGQPIDRSALEEPSGR